jgi:voltage-gated potassium channel
MAIGTLTTISPFTLSDNGKIFSILLLILGFGLVAASAAFLGNLLLEGSWIELYRRRKVSKRLKSFSDHYIICGHGQVGKRVVKELTGIKNPLWLSTTMRKSSCGAKKWGFLVWIKTPWMKKR